MEGYFMILTSKKIPRALRFNLFLSFMLVLALALVDIHSSNAQSITPISHLNVVDAKGKLIGSILGPAQVALSIDGQPIVLTVDINQFAGSFGIVYFDSPDCTANAFTEAIPVKTLLPLMAVGLPGMTAYIVPNIQPQNIQVKSRSNGPFPDPPAYRCTNIDELVSGLGPTEPLVDLTTRFTPPFSIR